jgi:hypothetical protein
METRYVAIWKIHGANKIASGSVIHTIGDDHGVNVVATFANDPEPYFLYADQASAALKLMVTKGFWSPEAHGDFSDLLAAEIQEQRSRRANQTSSSAFLILEGKAIVADQQFNVHRITDAFSFSMDKIDLRDVEEIFSQFATSIIASISLAFEPNANRDVEKLASVIFLNDPNSGNPIYPVKYKVGKHKLSIAKPLTLEMIDFIRERTVNILDTKKLLRSATLLSLSLHNDTEELLAFISSWSALEMFVDTSFSAVYESIWFSIMKNGAPASAVPILELLRASMRNNDRLAEKFLIIASVLDPDSATADDSEFRSLRKIRNNLFHRADIPSELPTERTQALLIKYLKKHLDRKE